MPFHHAPGIHATRSHNFAELQPIPLQPHVLRVYPLINSQAVSNFAIRLTESTELLEPNKYFFCLLVIALILLSATNSAALRHFDLHSARQTRQVLTSHHKRILSSRLQVAIVKGHTKYRHSHKCVCSNSLECLTSYYSSYLVSVAEHPENSIK